jgi:hypothetical protein
MYKKYLQIFCATNECGSDHKKWCFLLKQMVNKKKKSVTQTNKNMTQMEVIIKGIYCT